jgi:hypothetical protein
MVDSIPTFVQGLNQGSVSLQLPILSIAKCLDSIDEMLKARQHVPDEIVKMVWENLRGVCPTCCVWTNGQTLSAVKMISHFDRSNVTLTGYGDKSHLLDGRCINDACSSRDIVLIWQGSEPILQQLVRHLQRTKRSAEEEASSTKLRCLEMLSQSEIISFTIDTIFALQRNASHRHIYLKRTFPNLVLWVSVIPYPPELAREVFPRGYPAFLEEILMESGYDEGNVVVGHWICIGDAFSLINGWNQPDPNEWLLNLALVSEKSLPEQDKFLIVPSELCKE